MPTPKEGLASVGAFIRAARIARGINQLRASREAKVSRRQLAILEKGGNVSVQFLLKVANYLGVTKLPLDGRVELVSGESGLHLPQLMQILDLAAALVDHARTVAVESALPPSARGLKHTSAFKEFVARHAGDPERMQRLARAIMQLSDDVTPVASSPAPQDAGEDRQGVRQRTRKRRA